MFWGRNFVSFIWSFHVFRSTAVQLAQPNNLCLGWKEKNIQTSPNRCCSLLAPLTGCLPAVTTDVTTQSALQHLGPSVSHPLGRGGLRNELWDHSNVGWCGFDGHVLTAVHPSCFQILKYLCLAWRGASVLNAGPVVWCAGLLYLFISCCSAPPW